MDPEDFMTPEVGITAAVVAAVASPTLRKAVRRGAVLGVAGILMAGDAVTAFARGLGQGAQSSAQGTSGASARDGQQEPVGQQSEAQSAKESS